MGDLARRFNELTRLVPIPYPWDLDVYVRRVSDFRGRLITLCPIDPGALAGSGCGTGSGMWIARQDDDVIMYSADTAYHADHIIAHELGHMLLGHDSDPSTATSSDITAADLPLQALMPALSLETIQSVLRRDDYDTDLELEAENFANMLIVEATLPQRRPSDFRTTFFRGRHR